LKDQSDAAAQSGSGPDSGPKLRTPQGNASRLQGQYTRQGEEEAGFSRPVGAYQRGALPRFQVQAEIPYNRRPAGISRRYIPQG
jgi:hypothetical protein